MKISVVIPTLNEEHYLDNILTDLESQTVQPDEIIVVDGKSADSTVQIVKKRANIVLKSVAANAGRQRHLGAKTATGDWLIFFDGDSRIDSTFIQSSVKEIAQKKLEIAIPKYLPYQKTTHWFLTVFSTFINWYYLQMGKINPCGAGAGILVSKTLYNKTGGFDERYRIEDVPFIREAAKLGTYGIINTVVRCSDRRFKKYGYVRTTITYGMLAILYSFNLYRLGNNLDYEFGKFKKA